MNNKILSIISFLTLSFVNAEESLILNYSFDDLKMEKTGEVWIYYAEEGVVKDSSPQGNHGNVFHGKPSVDRNGDENKSIYFDGALSLIWLESDSKILDYSDNLSVSFWGKFEDMINTQTIFTENSRKDDNYFAKTSLILVNGELQFGFNNKLKSKIKVPNEGWNHYIISLDVKEKYVKFYVNGELESMNMFLDSNITNESDTYYLNIGLLQSFQLNYMPLKGNLDDLKFYNRTLTDVDVMGMSPLPSVGENPCFECEKRIKYLYDKKEAMKEIINSLEQDKLNLNEELVNAEERINQLNKELSTLREEVSSLKESNNEDRQLINLLNTELTQNNKIDASTFINGWVYYPDVGWLWTNNSVYPMIYNSETNSWINYKLGTSSPRLFYSYGQGEWQTWGEQ